MLCPEVWNFKVPESIFTTQKLDTNHKNRINHIDSFYYNHLVSVFLPDIFKVPESLSKSLITDCDYYKIAQFKPSDLITKEFLTSFVNCGRLYILSIHSRIDCDNCLAVTPEGSLVLNLVKSTFQSLGLEGATSHYHTRTGDRYSKEQFINAQREFQNTRR